MKKRTETSYASTVIKNGRKKLRYEQNIFHIFSICSKNRISNIDTFSIKQDIFFNFCHCTVLLLQLCVHLPLPSSQRVKWEEYISAAESDVQCLLLELLTLTQLLLSNQKRLTSYCDRIWRRNNGLHMLGTSTVWSNININTAFCHFHTSSSRTCFITL